MVVIDNKEDNDPKDNPTNKNNPSTHDVNDNGTKTERYTVDKRELTFPIEGLKNASIVKEGADISDGKLNDVLINKTPEEAKAEQLERLPYDDQDLKFIHLPDDPAYRPISVELIKLNEFQNEDLKINTRIMMNIALSDYVIFRRVTDSEHAGHIVENVKVYFRRLRTTEFQDYVDLQTELDDLVKRVNIIEMKYPPTIEQQDELYSYQKKLILVARKRVRKGFDVFFDWKDQKFRNEVFEEADSNDVTFNVDSAFIRLTKSPFLRRKSSPTS